MEWKLVVGFWARNVNERPETISILPKAME